MQYPGIIIPIGFADKNVDRDDLAQPDSERPCKLGHSLTSKPNMSLTACYVDDAQVVHGAPTSVQVVARNYHDEELIAACRVIDEVLRM